MRILPSIPAAIVTGAVVMPVFMSGCNWIEKTTGNPLLAFLWAVPGFWIPLFFSTMDMREVMRRWRRDGLFRVRVERGDLRRLYLPAWIRMGVLFVSTVLSVFILKTLGLTL